MNLINAHKNQMQVISVAENRVDSAVAIQFKDGLRALTQGSTGPVILDLSQVNFMDSSGLGALVAVMKNLGADQKLSIVGLSPTVGKVFRLTRMDKIFSIFSDVPAALDALAPTA